jgi:hypothetical protein
MSKAARVQEPLVSEPVSEGKVCPLFARQVPPIYADDVLEIKLQRIDKKGTHVDLAMEEFYIDGDPEEEPFAIDPYETTEQDLQLQFGGGTYWIEAFKKPDGSVWKGSGRRLVLGGPSKAVDPTAKRAKGPGDEDDESEDDEDEEREAALGPSLVQTPVESPLLEAMRIAQQNADRQAQLAREASERQARLAQEAADKRAALAEQNARQQQAMMTEHVNRTIDLNQMFTTAMLTRNDPTATEERIRALRDENESLRSRLSRDLDDVRQKHRDDLSRLESQHNETLRAERGRHEELMRTERQRNDTQIDELRSRHRAQEDEQRQRWTHDVQDIRSRYEQQLSQLREERSAERMKLQGEQERDRTKYEEQIRSLQRENLELEKKQITAQAELEALQNAPPSGPNFMEYLVRFAGTPFGERVLVGVLAKAQAAAAAAEANAATAQQAQVQQASEPSAAEPVAAQPQAPETAAPQQRVGVFAPTPSAPTPWATPAPSPPAQTAPPATQASEPIVDATRPVNTSVTTAATPEAQTNGVAHAPAPEAPTNAQDNAA